MRERMVKLLKKTKGKDKFEMIKAVRLRCEYLTDPIGIDIRKPRLSWNCQDGEKQTAYRILAQKDGEVIWDSGKIESSQMHLVPWGGKELKSRDKVCWKVQLWDEKDKEGQWSGEAFFELGLLKSSDWRAKWISGNYKVNKKKRYPVDCFRKRFWAQKKKIVRARAYMTACGIYEGDLNGQKIGDFCLAPGITDYRKRIQYQTVDVTDQILPGKNEVLFMLADGWYRGSVGAWGMKNCYGSETRLLAQIEISYEDGETQVISTDETFEWTNEGPIRFTDNKDGEIYDARREDLEKAKWWTAKLTSHNVTPTASDNFAVKEHERLSVSRVITTPSGKTVFDFGQNIAGYVEFDVKARKGQHIFLRFGEKLDGDGEFTQHNIQCVKKNYITPLQQIDYICKDGRNHYKTRFAIFGFQYVLVEADCPIEADDMTAIAVYSDFETTFRFDSSNRLLNKFVLNTLWSLKNNSADLPTDCPTRERHGWSGDAQIFVGTATYMVNYTPFAEKYERDLCDWQTRDGCFPQIAPEGGTDAYMRSMNGSSGWADAGVIIPYRLWKMSGDMGVIEKFYDSMKKYAHYMMKRAGKTNPVTSEKNNVKGEDKKYLYNIGQHYGEWAEPTDVHAMCFKDFVKSQPEVSTAYMSYVMSLMVEIAKALGKTEDLPLYREYAEGSKRVYQELVSDPKFTLDTDRQAKLVRPLYFHMLNEKQTRFAKKRLIEAMDHYRWRVGTGFLSTPLIPYVLEDIDIEYAYKLLENEEKPGWLAMPKAGATTIWEDWNGPDTDNGKGGGIASLDHYSKGAVCQWIFEEMCGIRVDGENHFRIAPHPGGHFTFAGFSYDSVYGTVSCRWEKKEDEEYVYTITIPSNTSARVILPGREEEELGAGTYHFCSTKP
ncbi:MAG: family 78 glycoside hydrolase catalytic domain [Lachnospiraceae bacterium]|nr:family 78 glycoside hydrolase catalytic domain [Lachnospiraceae bacterium]